MIDVEMIATGQPFLRTLRALAREYGVPFNEGPDDPAERRRSFLARREAIGQAYAWRTGYLSMIGELLAEEKAKLVDPQSGRANQRLISHLTEMERLIRKAHGPWALLNLYEAALASAMGEDAARLAKYGTEIEREQREFVEWLLDRLAERGPR